MWLGRLGLVLLNVLVFLLEEGWIIAMVAIFPFWLAAISVTLLLSTFSIISSYLCSLGDLPLILQRWIDKKKEKAKARLAKVMDGAFLISVLSTAIIVSPTTSAVMLHLLGYTRIKAYLLDIFFSFISGTIWCGIYGGGIFMLKVILK